MEAVISNDTATRTGDTRDAFLKTAKRLFAEKGFYGTSIAAVAAELDLTKQALIHHFGTKERLYGEVLAQLADRLSSDVARSRAAHPDPAQRVEDLLLNLYANTLKYPEETQLLMRELLDNKSRAGEAHSWYLRDFLDAVVAMIREVPSAASLTEAEALARIYMILGAANFFAVSQPTLQNMYNQREYRALKKKFPDELRRVVRLSLTAARAAKDG